MRGVFRIPFALLDLLATKVMHLFPIISVARLSPAVRPLRASVHALSLSTIHHHESIWTFVLRISLYVYRYLLVAATRQESKYRPIRQLNISIKDVTSIPPHSLLSFRLW